MKKQQYFWLFGISIIVFLFLGVPYVLGQSDDIRIEWIARYGDGRLSLHISTLRDVTIDLVEIESDNGNIALSPADESMIVYLLIMDASDSLVNVAPSLVNSLETLLAENTAIRLIAFTTGVSDTQTSDSIAVLDAFDPQASQVSCVYDALNHLINAERTGQHARRILLIVGDSGDQDICDFERIDTLEMPIDVLHIGGAGSDLAEEIAELSGGNYANIAGNPQAIETQLNETRIGWDRSVYLFQSESGVDVSSESVIVVQLSDGRRVSRDVVIQDIPEIYVDGTPFTPSPTPTATATHTPTATFTPSPTDTPTLTPTETPTETPSRTPTELPSPTVETTEEIASFSMTTTAEAVIVATALPSPTGETQPTPDSNGVNGNQRLIFVGFFAGIIIIATVYFVYRLYSLNQKQIAIVTEPTISDSSVPEGAFDEENNFYRVDKDDSNKPILQAKATVGQNGDDVSDDTIEDYEDNTMPLGIDESPTGRVFVPVTAILIDQISQIVYNIVKPQDSDEITIQGAVEIVTANIVITKVGETQLAIQPSGELPISVNDEPVTTTQTLKSGDVIQIADQNRYIFNYLED